MPSALTAPIFNVGASADDPTADDLQTAFGKAEAAFAALVAANSTLKGGASPNGDTLGKLEALVAAAIAAPAADVAALKGSASAGADTLGKLEGLVSAAQQLASGTAATVSAILAGSNAAVDTFIDAYNRFVSNESAAAALTAVVASKVGVPELTVGLSFKLDKAGGAVTGPMQLGVGAPSQFMTTVDPAKLRLWSVEGSPGSPKADSAYNNPALYMERHTAGAATGTISGWGSPYMETMALLEVNAAAGSTNQVTALATRVSSYTAAPSTSDPLKNLLVPLASLVQLAAPNGQPNRQGWAGNFVAAWMSGNNPGNLACIEADLTFAAGKGSAGGLPGVNDNLTNVWAVADGAPGSYGSAAFFANAARAGTGWFYGACLVAEFKTFAGYMKNIGTAAGNGGLYVEIGRNNFDTAIAQFNIGTQRNFLVDGSSFNPVSLQVGGAFRNIQAKKKSDLADSDLVLTGV